VPEVPNIPVRCPQSGPELGHKKKKIAGTCSDPDDRVDLSPGKLFSKPPGSKSQHIHICHSVGIL